MENLGTDQTIGRQRHFRLVFRATHSLSNYEFYLMIIKSLHYQHFCQSELSHLPRKKQKKKTKQLTIENDSALVEEMFTAFEQIFRDGRFSEKCPISKENPNSEKRPATKIVKKAVRKRKSDDDSSSVPEITEVYPSLEEAKRVTPTSVELEIIDESENEEQPDSKCTFD